MTSPAYLLALDQGSQSTRAVLFDQRGRKLHQASVAIPLIRHDSQRVEQDGKTIIASLHDCLDQVLQQAGIRAERIAALGLTSQRSSVIAWQADTQQACSPVLSWQDIRCTHWIKQHQACAATVRDKTGLPFSPHYGASKIHWLLQNAGADEKLPVNLRIGPVVSFYLSQLLQTPHALVDTASALRTQLVNLDTLDWDPELLEFFAIPRALLPDIVPVCHDFGRLAQSGIAVTAVNGDQPASLFAQGELPPRTAWVNLGTGGFIQYPCRQQLSVAGLLTSLVHNDAESRLYAVEGTVNGAGAALLWAKDHLQLTEQIPELLERAEQSYPQTSLIFINTVAGLGSPWWQPESNPCWLDLRGSRPETVPAMVALVAVCESILFMIFTNLKRMLDAGCDIATLHISGGLSNAPLFGQGLADLSGLPVRQFPDTEMTARGIAFLAAGCPDDWVRDDPQQFNPQPNPGLRQRYDLFRDFLNQHLSQVR
ncbi:FGGY family carbohydrate kinase [Neptuniibacter sp. CAU 1671]|uniref:FGGY family carbohydrate kinase n=1 Tax=Neptuniibacter sp. CAU 1671 TaxID=3032593 RepID=UPI0023DA38BA|nr:FGGY family carbohydrate kinase [Neptuniibacter sp. CAU 1671]MDF2182203.1 FGGY family carbohydrate kinase [Neptuniibacter sp. CAU 1671]